MGDLTHVSNFLIHGIVHVALCIALAALVYSSFSFVITRSSATAEKQRVSCPHGGG